MPQILLVLQMRACSRDLEKKSPNMISDLSSGRMIVDGFIFQERICIGIYEVGQDQKATVETLMNHLLVYIWSICDFIDSYSNVSFRLSISWYVHAIIQNHKLDSQETTANHLKKIGLMDICFGLEEMSKQNLTWVVAKIQMVVDRYPTWYI